MTRTTYRNGGLISTREKPGRACFITLGRSNPSARARSLRALLHVSVICHDDGRLQSRGHDAEVSMKGPNEMTEIVESDRVARVRHSHSRLQQIPRTQKPEANEVLVWRHSDQLSEYAREPERTHRN